MGFVLGIYYYFFPSLSSPYLSVQEREGKEGKGEVCVCVCVYQKSKLSLSLSLSLCKGVKEFS